MSIRDMLITTAVFAGILALGRANWAVSAFSSSCLASVIVARYRCPGKFSQNMKRIAVGMTLVCVYVLSIGPALGCLQFHLNYDSYAPAPWDTAPIRTLFPLQASVVDFVQGTGAPNGRSAMLDLVADYTWRWRCIGWSARSFSDALFG